MLIVDRSVDPVATINYTIPYEDPAEPGEVEDGRTHQFFGLCREHNPYNGLPRWISHADVDAALAKDLLGGQVLDDDDVLETNGLWEQCWYRITGDDERRPITFEQASQPVLWDTSDLEVGGYVIEGYTWDPPLNIWSFRTGVIKVVDSEDLAASPPAVAVELNPTITFSHEPVSLEVCHSTTDGSTLSAYWSIGGVTEQEWFPFVEDEPVVGESSTVEFLPPEAAADETVVVRVTVTDPMDRETTAYAKYPIVVVAESVPGECDGPFMVDPECEVTGTDSSGATSSGSDSEGPTSGADTDGACACRLEAPRPSAALTLLALVSLCGRRRR